MAELETSRDIALYRVGVPRRVVAERFGLNVNHVSDITSGHAWRDVA